MEVRRTPRAILLAHEVADDQMSAWSERASDLGEPLTLQWRWQVMLYEGREHDVEGLVGEEQLLDHGDLKADRRMRPRAKAARAICWGQCRRRDRMRQRD